jgi:hypothetical protein
VVRTLSFFAVVVAALVTASAAMATTARPETSVPLALVAQKVAPKRQPVVLGFFKGRTIRYFDFGPIKLKPGNKIAPIWAFKNGASGQRNVVDAVPGQAAYSPLWRVNEVTWAKSAKRRVLDSAVEIQAAARAGQLTIRQTKTVVNCPVLGFGQKEHAGFSGGKKIAYYDLGAVKVAPGNEVIPLWTVKNGVSGQRNIAENIVPGTTAYPPLWAIVEVTWKAGAKPRLLTSLAAIKKAQAAGQVSLKNSGLVVNCPLV